MCEQTETVLRAYLRRTLGICEDAWGLRPSGVSGRGVFATRDLAPGDLIFHDRPVVYGPRIKIDEPVCASCHRKGRVFKCPAGCYLPICSPECSTSSNHVNQCSIVREMVDMADGEWRLDLVSTVVPLRCLSLSDEDREVVQCLQGNPGKIHGVEVDLLKRYLKDKLSKENEEWMRQCCLAMDTNAFEFVKVLNDGSQTSLRGLYPLAAIMNHNCSPNSSHVYDADGIMKLFAARLIKADEEITGSYTGILWPTTLRRLNLASTKHFWCGCDRCSDPTEFGSQLSGLPCTVKHCPGSLLPAHPLNTSSPWFCSSCEVEASAKEANKLQATQGYIMQKLASAEPPMLIRWLKAQSKLSPNCQMIVQLKLSLVWDLGHKNGFSWSEISQEMLDLKEQFCHDIILLLDLLRCGYCRMRGLILLEIHGALQEQQRRLQFRGLTRQGIEAESKVTLATARIILQDDATVQKKLSQAAEDDFFLSALPA